jgi:hypothetical protein
MIVSVKKPGFPGFFILGLLGRATGCHPSLAQNRKVFREVVERYTIERDGLTKG